MYPRFTYLYHNAEGKLCVAPYRRTERGGRFLTTTFTARANKLARSAPATNPGWLLY